MIRTLNLLRKEECIESMNNNLIKDKEDLSQIKHKIKLLQVHPKLLKPEKVIKLVQMK